VHLRKVLEEMPMSVNTDLNPIYELHCDEVKLFLLIFKQIAPALNRCICCFLERRIQQEKHVLQLKEP
jgi:hypothetical protein